jgi:hypothetical protein
MPLAVSGKASSKKRKAAEVDEEDDVELADLDDFNPSDWIVNKDCDQVRRLINRFLDLGTMTKTAFAREIGVSLSSLSGFLGANGPTAGSRSAAYNAAWEYFRKREMSGMEMPAKKQKTTDAHAEMEGPTKPAAGKKTKAPAGPVDVSDIYLEGEEDDDVLCFDTADEIRRKITVYLKWPGMTQALLCRQIYAECKGPERPERCFQASQLAQFRKAKGPLNGARKPIFYGAYVFFEKLRIKEGKPKSKHRQDMELIWQGEGLPRERDIGRQK